MTNSHPTTQVFRGLRPWGAIVLAGMATLLTLTLGVYESHADVSGTSKGHGFTVQGSVLGQAWSHNLVALPPGGSAGQSLNRSAGSAAVTADTAIVECSGPSSGPSVAATCSSLVENLNLTNAGQQLLFARTLRAQSTSADSGAGGSSNDSGTQIDGLCVVQSVVGSCVPVTSPGTVSVGIPGVASGSVVVKQETARFSDGGVAGSGLTVTMLHIDLSIVGQGAVVLDIAQADTFVGGVAVSPSGSNPTPPPGGTTPPPSLDGPGTPPSNSQPGGGTGITGFPQNLPRSGGPLAAETQGIDWALAALMLLTSGAGIMISARRLG